MRERSAKTSDKIPAIEVKDCVVAFGDRLVIEGVSFAIEQGDIAAVIGPNGSGKTTLLKAILGLLPMKSGDVKLFGKHLHTVRTMIGYVPQRFDFDRNFPITVREFMDLARRIHCRRHFPPSRIDEKIDEVGLPRDILDKRLGELSGGQLQRVLIAQAIINDPAILFLDEPSSGIDIMGEAAFFAVLDHLKKVHNTTIVIVSHDITMISHLVDTVVCINRRLLCFGPPAAALTRHKLEEVFGSHYEPYDHHDHRGHQRPRKQ